MFCDNLDMWDGVGSGFKRERRHMHTYGSFTLLYGRKQHKAIILQLKKKELLITKKISSRIGMSTLYCSLKIIKLGDYQNKQGI